MDRKGISCVGWVAVFLATQSSINPPDWLPYRRPCYFRLVRPTTPARRQISPDSIRPNPIRQTARLCSQSASGMTLAMDRHVVAPPIVRWAGYAPVFSFSIAAVISSDVMRLLLTLPTALTCCCRNRRGDTEIHLESVLLPWIK